MKNVNKIRMRETIVSYCFLAPVLIFFVVFVLVPMIMGFVTSFFNYTMIDFTFVGIDNYVRMFNGQYVDHRNRFCASCSDLLLVCGITDL